MEHSWKLSPFVGAACQLLSPGNAWHKTKIVWAGDYMDEALYIPQDEEPIDDGGDIIDREKMTLYSLASIRFSKGDKNQTDGPDIRFIVNHTKNEYVDMNKLPESEEGWRVHPLPILTSSGCFRGGGDYRDESNKYVGSWAGDIISTSYELPEGMTVMPEGMTEIFPDFKL
jgi:hypothetical protein